MAPSPMAGSLGLDGVDRLLSLLAERVRDRRGAGVLRGNLLALLRDHKAEERLDQGSIDAGDGRFRGDSRSTEVPR